MRRYSKSNLGMFVAAAMLAGVHASYADPIYTRPLRSSHEQSEEERQARTGKAEAKRRRKAARLARLENKQ